MRWRRWTRRRELRRQFAPNTGSAPFSMMSPAPPVTAATDAGCCATPAILRRQRGRRLPGCVGRTASSRICALAEQLPPGIPYLATSSPAFGSGSIEAFPETAIVANVDPNDSDGYGIWAARTTSSAADFVPATKPAGGPGLKLGRFSAARRRTPCSSSRWSLRASRGHGHHVAVPADGESQSLREKFPQKPLDRVPHRKCSSHLAQAVTHYVRALSPPEPGPDTERRVQGRRALHADPVRQLPRARQFQQPGPSPIPGLAVPDGARLLGFPAPRHGKTWSRKTPPTGRRRAASGARAALGPARSRAVLRAGAAAAGRCAQRSRKRSSCTAARRWRCAAAFWSASAHSARLCARLRRVPMSDNRLDRREFMTVCALGGAALLLTVRRARHTPGAGERQSRAGCRWRYPGLEKPDGAYNSSSRLARLIRSMCLPEQRGAGSRRRRPSARIAAAPWT